MNGRFDYVKFDDIAQSAQNVLKSYFTTLELSIEVNCKSPRAKALALAKLEECYMWAGKAIRDDQIARNGSAPLQEERKNG